VNWLNSATGSYSMLEYNIPRSKLAEGLVAAFGEALGLFEPLPAEDDLVGQGILPVPHAELLQRWLDGVAAELAAVDLERVIEQGVTPREGEFVPTSSGELVEAGDGGGLSAPHVERSGDGAGRWVLVGEFSGRGGRHGRHSEDFTELWEEMTATYRNHPGATW
jgi:1,2-phenylacetyl-CoA epoxidase catalytic subunit